MEEKWFVWAMRMNLQWIVKFHNESRRLMGNQIAEIDKSIQTEEDQTRKRELLYAREIYHTTFDRMLQINTFLMMYSYLEEFLYHLWKVFSPETEIARKGSITRFKRIFKEVLGMDLQKDTDWPFICDCEKIRDCLLHANGRIDLSKDKVELEKIVTRSEGWLAVNLERIVLTGEFLEKVRDALSDFVEKIESKVPA